MSSSCNTLVINSWHSDCLSNYSSMTDKSSQNVSHRWGHKWHAHLCL